MAKCQCRHSKRLTASTDEASSIAYLRTKGMSVNKRANGHTVRAMSYRKPEMTADEYQLIGMLAYLQQLGMNDSPLADDEWAFLKSLPKLKTLST